MRAPQFEDDTRKLQAGSAGDECSAPALTAERLLALGANADPAIMNLAGCQPKLE